MATATGWGTLKEDGSPSCTLQEVDLRVMSNEECKNTNYDESVISDKMLCAGDVLGGKDSCQVKIVLKKFLSKKLSENGFINLIMLAFLAF